jgi:hypothetical protein
MKKKRLPVVVFVLLCHILLVSHASSGTRNTSTDSLPAPASVSFYGNLSADLFTKEVAASFDGVFRYSYFSHDSIFPAGFVRDSPDPQLCCNQFWSRDAGTFLRELVYWGYLDQARTVARCLIGLVGKNKEGYFAFPMYFDSYKKVSGNELDGSCTVTIGLCLLYLHLKIGDPVKQEIYAFLHGDDSPLAYIRYILRDHPLVAGEGEFGGGMWIQGPYYNVVQNHLCVLALMAYAKMESDAGDQNASLSARKDAGKLMNNIFTHLVNKDNTWIWCMDPKTMRSDSAVLNSIANKGFSGINGVMSMYADVEGLEPEISANHIYSISLQTFNKLYNEPARKRQFEKYGIWTQFDILAAGSLSSPAYGMGYGIQDMLLFDSLKMASHALDFLAQNIYRPIKEYTDLNRKSPYYFYERMYSPEAVGKMLIEQGCGALNLVNICEPFKIARIMLGIDDSNPDTLKLIPRLPDGWSGFDATNWPVYTRNGVVKIDMHYKRKGDVFQLDCRVSEKIKMIIIRLPENNRWKYFTIHNRDQISLKTKT